MPNQPAALRFEPLAATSTRRSPGRRGRPVGELDDGHLVGAISVGHEGALAEAYRRHAAPVHGMARRLCGPNRASEVTQEVFLRLWNQPDLFDQARGSLRSFLVLQAHSRAVDVIRSDGARRARETADIEHRAVDDGPDDEIAVSIALTDVVDRLLAELPRPERVAIMLAFFGGYTYREVASHLAEPEGTIKTRIRSGLTRLRGHLEATGQDEATLLAR